MNTGIYKITNIINNQFYIGSSNDLKQRIAEHKHELKFNKHSNQRLQNSYNKYGVENFKFEIIEICIEIKLVEREQYWMDLTNCYNRNIGYNIRKIAESNRGIKWSDDYKNKMSKILTGRKFTEEHKKKIGLKSKGRKLSTKAKNKIAWSKIGKKQSQEQINNRILYCRNFNKWPCADGYKCKCEKCMYKKKADWKIKNDKARKNLIGSWL